MNGVCPADDSVFSPSMLPALSTFMDISMYVQPSAKMATHFQFCNTVMLGVMLEVTLGTGFEVETTLVGQPCKITLEEDSEFDIFRFSFQDGKVLYRVADLFQSEADHHNLEKNTSQAFSRAMTALFCEEHHEKDFVQMVTSLAGGKLDGYKEDDQLNVMYYHSYLKAAKLSDRRERSGWFYCKLHGHEVKVTLDQVERSRFLMKALGKPVGMCIFVEAAQMFPTLENLRSYTAPIERNGGTGFCKETF